MLLWNHSKHYVCLFWQMHVHAIHCKLWHLLSSQQLLQHWKCPFQQGIPACPFERSWLMLTSFRRKVFGLNGRAAGSVWWYDKKRSGGVAKWKPLIKISTFPVSLSLFLIAAKPDELSECMCACARRHVTFTLHQANCLGSLLTAPCASEARWEAVLGNSIKGRPPLATSKNINGCLQVVVVSSHTWVCFSAVFSWSGYWLDSKIMYVLYYLTFCVWVSKLYVTVF